MVNPVMMISLHWPSDPGWITKIKVSIDEGEVV